MCIRDRYLGKGGGTKFEDSGTKWYKKKVQKYCCGFDPLRWKGGASVTDKDDFKLTNFAFCTLFTWFRNRIKECSCLNFVLNFNSPMDIR